MRCPLPVPCRSDFRVLHTNGIHDVSISYCGCHRALPHHIQLLRRGLYPSSQVFSRTVVTFTLLRLIHLLSLTSKISMYDLYRTLERLTDNAGSSVPKSRYRPLLRVAIQWRHLKNAEARWQSAWRGRCGSYKRWRACCVVPFVSPPRN